MGRGGRESLYIERERESRFRERERGLFASPIPRGKLTFAKLTFGTPDTLRQVDFWQPLSGLWSGRGGDPCGQGLDGYSLPGGKG